LLILYYFIVLSTDEDDTNSEGEAAAKSKLEAILEMIKNNRNVIRLRPSKNGMSCVVLLTYKLQLFLHNILG